MKRPFLQNLFWDDSANIVNVHRLFNLIFLFNDKSVSVHHNIQLYTKQIIKVLGTLLSRERIKMALGKVYRFSLYSIQFNNNTKK